MRSPVLLLAATALGTLACEPYTKPFSAADRAAVRATVDTFTARVLRSDWAGASKMYAPGARFMPPNDKMVVGPAAIEKWMHAFPPINSFALTVDTIEGSGDVAYTVGHYAMSVTPPGAKAPMTDAGKYLEVHVRQADGSWLNVADEFNSDQPMAPPAPTSKPAPARRRGR
ncbi:MAG TPA: nuclear transport factor 2 family protein [Gemmatimonadales bacterium]